jgi:acetyl-CoA C-acetyltransferase
MKLSDIVILSGVRTAIGAFGGSLSTLTPAELGTAAAKEAIKRSGINPEDIDHSIFGHIIPTSEQDAYIARHIGLNSGLPTSSAALNVNRLCGSAVQSVISAAQMLILGDSTIALAGGAESMSKGAYILPNARSGLRMGDAKMVDLTIGTLSDPFGSGHMGITAENIAKEYNINREQLDTFSVESHKRATAAIEAGYFTEQIVPVTVKRGRNSFTFSQDEHVRTDASVAGLAKLKPAFKKDGIVTAGNASGLNDGAAALVLTTNDEANKRGLTPQARFISYAFAGVNPDVMGLGPIPAVKTALEKANLTIDDIDVIESNEAFAAQAMAVSQTLGFDAKKVNPNGGAVALGHPVGATGSILIIKTIAELKRTNKRYGLITMCIGGGQGIALIIENI